MVECRGSREREIEEIENSKTNKLVVDKTDTRLRNGLKKITLHNF